MAIQFACSCGQVLQARDEHAGFVVRCPKCGRESVVPGPEAVQPADALPAPAPARRPPADEAIERPRRAARREDDDEDDRPARSRRRRFEDDDEDDYDEDRPRGPSGSSGKATAALVLGLLSIFCFSFLSGLPAILLGALGLRDIGRSRGRLGGKGLAITGIVTGLIGSICVPFLLVPAFLKVGEAQDRMRATNNLHQIGIAQHIHHDATGSLARGIARGGPQGPDGELLLSWRVAILPYVEQDRLYRQFKLDEPWDSPHNKALLTPMPAVFAHPRDPEATRQGLTYYRIFVGPGALFESAQTARFPNVTDGTSNTIMVIEAADPVPWTKPDELVYNPTGPLPKVGGKFSGGTLTLMADGSVRVVPPSTPEPTLRGMITSRGGEVLVLP
jgi:hypothetical protein